MGTNAGSAGPTRHLAGQTYPTLSVMNSVHFRVHVIYRTSRGYCTEPCAECGILISDAKPYIILEKDWLPRHVVCFQCPTCSDVHLPPYDGSCLL